MKINLVLAAAAAAFAFSLPAAAGVDADAALKLTKDSGCSKCHSVDKGKADGEAKLVDILTKSPKVKMDDGSEEEHKAVSTKDVAQVKNLVQWILAQSARTCHAGLDPASTLARPGGLRIKP